MKNLNEIVRSYRETLFHFRFYYAASRSHKKEVIRMKTSKLIMAIFAALIALFMINCASGSRVPEPTVRVIELENKGSVIRASTPNWVTTYIEHGISRVQALPEFRDRYCVIGEESSVNRQFALAWADSFSAQQRIGQMLRINIASQFEARIRGEAQSIGLAGASSGEIQQEIDSLINAVINVSFSGAQREADWWSLRRRYDPDLIDVFSDDYTAFVLYTIPKAEMNRQIAWALETSVSADSALYDITIELARNILLGSMNYLGEGELSPAETPPQTPEQRIEINAAVSGTITIRNNSSRTGNVMTEVRIYRGFDVRGEPFMVYDRQVLGNQQVSWDLPEGVYTVEVFLNNDNVGRNRTVDVTARGVFAADFFDGNLSLFYRR
jgi:hypothetical protein